jgi:hypothetical protein
MQLMNHALAKAALPLEAELILRKVLDKISTSLINREEAGSANSAGRPATSGAGG